MNRTRRVAVVATSALAAAALIASTAGPALASAPAHHGRPAAAKHVLLLSVDGLHQKDLVWYAKKNPRSALAQLVRQGTSYSHAQTPVPSDSFPGMVGQASTTTTRTTTRSSPRAPPRAPASPPAPRSP
jgi:hypothetical protein